MKYKYTIILMQHVNVQYQLYVNKTTYKIAIKCITLILLLYICTITTPIYKKYQYII